MRLKGLWIIGSRTIIPTTLASNGVDRLSALVGPPGCGIQIGFQTLAPFFPCVPYYEALTGSDLDHPYPRFLGESLQPRPRRAFTIATQ